MWWKLGILCAVLMCLQGCIRYVNPRHCICSCLCEHVVDYFTQDGHCVFVCIQIVWETYVDNICGSQVCGEYAGVCWKGCVPVCLWVHAHVKADDTKKGGPRALNNPAQCLQHARSSSNLFPETYLKVFF